MHTTTSADTDPAALVPALPSSQELREALFRRLREAQELRALIKIAVAREKDPKVKSYLRRLAESPP